MLQSSHKRGLIGRMGHVLLRTGLFVNGSGDIAGREVKRGRRLLNLEKVDSLFPISIKFYRKAIAPELFKFRTCVYEVKMLGRMFQHFDT